jgi:hypothetical protein
LSSLGVLELTDSLVIKNSILALISVIVFGVQAEEVKSEEESKEQLKDVLLQQVAKKVGAYREKLGSEQNLKFLELN